MAYGVDALGQLSARVATIGHGGSVLELGAQDVNADVPDEAIFSFLVTTHGKEESAQRAANLLPERRPLRACELFRGSKYSYRSIDLFDGEFIINADLNIWRVPDQDRSTFDLITNNGTTEHVADQINCFRVIHDYAAVGATMIHNVPFSGYFNHGLFNYHPLFFIFLAHANGYEIRRIGLSPPHLPYTIPDMEGIYHRGWEGQKIQSGIVSCDLRKTKDAPFQIFTDFDQETLRRMTLPEPWGKIVRDRYDLRVR